MLNDAEDHHHAGPDYSVPPVVRAIKVLRHIAAGRSVSNQSQAARALGINRTTLLRLLRTLEAEGFIERIPDTDDFTLGTGVIELAANKIYSFDAAQVASPVLARLTAQLGLSSHLGVLEGREVLYVLRHAPNLHLVSNVRIGTRMPAYASTLGRTILAHMPVADVRALYRDVPLVPVTDKTATTLRELEKQLDVVRQEGISDARSGYEIGIDAIGAPVFDHSGTAIAAINVSGPERAFATPANRRAEIAAALLDAAAEISKRLGYIDKTGKRARG
ncbi:MAG: IclR family transcriptional regulator [Hyphomicrobiaceae bacterium]